MPRHFSFCLGLCSLWATSRVYVTALGQYGLGMVPSCAYSIATDLVCSVNWPIHFPSNMSHLDFSWFFWGHLWFYSWGGDLVPLTVGFVPQNQVPGLRTILCVDQNSDVNNFYFFARGWTSDKWTQKRWRQWKGLMKHVIFVGLWLTTTYAYIHFNL